MGSCKLLLGGCCGCLLWAMCPAGTQCWRRNCIAPCAAHATAVAPAAPALSQRCPRHRSCHPGSFFGAERWSWASASANCPGCRCRRCRQPHRWAAPHRPRPMDVAAAAAGRSSWHPPGARPDSRSAVAACPPRCPSDAACVPVAPPPWQCACHAVRCSEWVGGIRQGISVIFPLRSTYRSRACSSGSGIGAPLQLCGCALWAGRPGPFLVCSFLRHLARRFWNQTCKG